MGMTTTSPECALRFMKRADFQRGQLANLCRGNIVTVHGFGEQVMIVLKRDGGEFWFKRYDGEPLPSRRNGGAWDHERQGVMNRSIADVTSVAVSRR
jgi:hypothetical protein